MSSRHVSSLFQIYPQKKSLFQIKSQDVQCPWQKKQMRMRKLSLYLARCAQVLVSIVEFPHAHHQYSWQQVLFD